SGHAPLSTSGMEGDSWILVDLIDVIVHLFSTQARLYYDFENLWGDARRVDWQAEAGQTNTSATDSES
ncbi:MAG: RsfS/YbeB/iojap family protein, partial [Phycisphaerae bacterium]|nr:RsfS/YbeB/iojap family protein [Phycisphaerae bacterium]